MPLSWQLQEGNPETVVFKGTFDPVLGHDTAIRSDTEGYVCGGGSVLVLAGCSEAFERQVPSLKWKSVVALGTAPALQRGP
jgi:hypothetical protein